MSQKANKSTTLWQMPEVGEVLFRRNIRAKRLTISIRPATGVRVTIPGYLSISSAKEFVAQKKEWIIEKLNEISNIRSQKALTTGYKTREHELLLVPTKTNNIKVSIQDKQMMLQFPEEISSTSHEIQTVVKVTIEKVFRLEANKILPARVESLAKTHSFEYNSLRIKNISSRWGSCSGVNNINLSIYLMKLPDDLIDYVILHELTHTVHKNHGPDFWNHLNRITGNAKGLAARVKKYSTGV